MEGKKVEVPEEKKILQVPVQEPVATKQPDPEAELREFQAKMAVMEQRRIEMFRQDLKALCDKYGVDLKITQQIEIIPRR